MIRILICLILLSISCIGYAEIKIVSSLKPIEKEIENSPKGTIVLLGVYPNNLKNWFLGRAKAPAVRSIAKRSVLMQYEPLCDRRTPGLWRSRKTSFSGCLGIGEPFTDQQYR